MLTDVATELLDLALPRHCVGCGAGGAALCAACTTGTIVEIDLDGSLALHVVAALPYDGAVRTALLAYKERGRRDLARPLRALLDGAIAAHSCPEATLVPVPSSSAARRARGGDHVRRLVGRRRSVSALRLVRAVRDSAGLGSAERVVNLAGALRAVPPRSPRTPVIIVDDITTTGATLREAAHALDAAGWAVRGAAVVAATARRLPSPGGAAPQGRTERVRRTRPADTAGTSRRAGLT